MKSISKYPFLCFVLLFGVFSCTADAQEIKTIKFDDLQAIIDSEDGTKLKVINFWATWCKPCVEEMPAFQTIAEKYSQSDVKVYLISMDFADELERVKKFATAKKLTAAVSLLNEPDYDSWINKVDPSWSGAIPATLMVKTDTNEKEFYEKGFELEELENTIKELLNK